MLSDARSMPGAYARGIAACIGPRIARADATDGRTDALTKNYSPDAESSSNASRAGGQTDFAISTAGLGASRLDASGTGPEQAWGDGMTGHLKEQAA